MNILYIQHVDSLPPMFVTFLELCSAPQAGLGKKLDNGWIIKADAMITGEGEEVNVFNQFMRMCQSKGYDALYTTKNPH